MNKSAFISPDKAYENHQSGQGVFVDATYGTPIDYTIPGSVHFDIDAVADPHAVMAHMMPDTKVFAEKVSAMGICNDDEIIVFDKSGFWMAAARVWWMFRTFGFDNIRILNGGISQWLGDLSPYNPSEIKSSATAFKAEFRQNLVVDFDDIQSAKDSDEYVIVDARPDMAFSNGHIDNSISIPLTKIIDEKGCLQPISKLHHILLPAIACGKRIMTSCGSGVTACALAAAFYECGLRDVAVYDGSWCEYSQRKGA